MAASAVADGKATPRSLEFIDLKKTFYGLILILIVSWYLIKKNELFYT